MNAETDRLPLLRDMYRMMLLIREFETSVQHRFRDGEIPGFVHVSIGQEACAVGAVSSLQPGDYVLTTHRGHGHAIAKGIDIKAMVREIYGLSSGVNGGRGGSMHISDASRGLLGANGIVGANLALGVGAAWATKLLREERVTMVFFGDGAVQQGLFHESMNLAAVMRIPIVFFCENNGYAEFSAHSTQTVGSSLEERARTYGVDALNVDGTDVEAVHKASERAIGTSRSQGVPTLIEARTYRASGHYEGDPQKYRSNEPADLKTSMDPIALARSRLVELGDQEDELAATERAARGEVSAVFEDVLGESRGARS